MFNLLMFNVESGSLGNKKRKYRWSVDGGA